jgi:hypothetical protein
MITTILEECTLPEGSLILKQDQYPTGNKFVTAEFKFNNKELKLDRKLPVFISITDFHAHLAKDAMIAYVTLLKDKK